MKSEFRSNIENALVLAGLATDVFFSDRIFLDRNKCSDRIKFTGVHVHSDTRRDRIVEEVQKFYPQEDVRVYNANMKSAVWSGLAVSVTHDNFKPHK